MLFYFNSKTLFLGTEFHYPRMYLQSKLNVHDVQLSKLYYLVVLIKINRVHGCVSWMQGFRILTLHYSLLNTTGVSSSQ
jgi:hypothetical protein